MEIRSLLAMIAIFIGAVGYVPYIRDIVRGKTRPHIYSWIIWTLMEAIACAAILAGGGYAGAWPHAITAVICLLVVSLTMKNPRSHISRLDANCFILSFCSVIFWAITSDPIFAVIFITLADALAYYPTFRKAYHKPHEETLSAFAFNLLKQILILCSLSQYSTTTVLFDAYLITANSCFVGMLIVRRRQLAAKL